MKTKMISTILLTLGLVLVLGSAVTPVHGGTQPSSPSVIGPPDRQFPVVTIQSTDNVTRGQIGTFVLSVNSKIQLATTFVNFSVSGTAIPGVDYTPLVSPDFIAQSGFGVLLVKTLPDPRASFVPQAYSVVVTLEPGPGYAVGQPSSAEMFIKP
jgi:hypothetical protein